MLAGAGDHLSLLHALELRDGELVLLLDLDHGGARRRCVRSSDLPETAFTRGFARSWHNVYMRGRPCAFVGVWYDSLTLN